MPTALRVVVGVLLAISAGCLWGRSSIVCVMPAGKSRTEELPRRLQVFNVLGALALPVQPIGESAAASATTDLPSAMQGAAWQAEVSTDGSGPVFTTIGGALAAAPKDVARIVIVVHPGNYREQLSIAAGAPVTVEARPPGRATLIWETGRPYEAALIVGPRARAVVRGLSIRHAGKSVANNYAVYSEGGDLTMDSCDVTSSTGAGVAAEGGRLVLRGGSVHDCARQGLVLFGPISGDEPLHAMVCGTVLRMNGNFFGDNDAIRGPFDGVLARNGVEAELCNVTIEGSGGTGISIFEETRIMLNGGTFQGNRQGETRVRNGGELIRGSPSGLDGC